VATSVVTVNDSLDGLGSVDPKCFDRIYLQRVGLSRAISERTGHPCHHRNRGVELATTTDGPLRGCGGLSGTAAPYPNPHLPPYSVACAAAAAVYIGMIGQPTAASCKPWCA
jgi:hypothetical protein